MTLRLVNIIFTLLQYSSNEYLSFLGYDCRKRCVGSADVSWPQSVGSGILKVFHPLLFISKNLFKLSILPRGQIFQILFGFLGCNAWRSWRKGLFVGSLR